MKKYSINIHESAEVDLFEIVNDKDEQMQGLGRKYYNKIRERIFSLENFPERYPCFLENSNLRVTYVFNYAIFYSTDKDKNTVNIIRILPAKFGDEKMNKLL